MDYKTVGKSKSSNGAIVSRTERIHNESLSHAKFQPAIMKKRGVYVEKKVQSSTGTQDGIVKNKPPPRPRPGQKKFLASVLTILSKSTTGTQYPDIQETEDRAKLRSKPRKITDAEEPSKTVQRNKIKKSKFKSRVLNDEMLRAEQEQLIILKSKRDITQTSNYSAKSKATDSTKWSNVFQDSEKPKRNPIREYLENNIYSGAAEDMTKDMESSKKKDKLRINDDPVTLASEIAKTDDEQLYNFFVDLLETTISLYNVRTECEPSDGSKIVLEINDSIAKKLDLKNQSHPHDDVNRTIDEPEKPIFHRKEYIPIDIKLSDYKPLEPMKPKIRAKSFVCPYSRQPKTPKSNSFEGKSRGPKKRALLSLLKEQLERDFTLKEPESLYDTLKVMARNKRRCEKSIRFDKKSNINRDFDPECMFQRKVLFGAKKKGKANNIATELRNRNDYGEINPKIQFPSHHSLEVYGYDYEEPVKRPEEKRLKRVIFTYYSTPSGSDSDMGDCNALIDYLDSSASSNYSVLNR